MEATTYVDLGPEQEIRISSQIPSDSTNVVIFSLYNTACFSKINEIEFVFCLQYENSGTAEQVSKSKWDCA